MSNVDEEQHDAGEKLDGKKPDHRHGYHGSLETHIHMVLGDARSMRSLKRDMGWFTDIQPDHYMDPAKFFDPTGSKATHTTPLSPVKSGFPVHRFRETGTV